MRYNKTTKNIIKANTLTGKQYVKEIDVEKYQILLNVKKESKDRNMINIVNIIDQSLSDGVVTNEEFNKIEDQFNKDVETSRAAGYKVMINEIKSEISKIK